MSSLVQDSRTTRTAATTTAAKRRREYDAYLASPEWQAKRTAALERDGHRCRVCNRDKYLDVHHRTYERFRAESLDDLTVLCRDCHALFHEDGQAVVRSKPAKRPRISVARKRVRAVVNELDPNVVYSSDEIVARAQIHKGMVMRCLGELLKRGMMSNPAKGKWKLADATAPPQPRTEPVPTLHGRKQRMEAKSKSEARERVRQALETLTAGQIVSTADIAVLAEVQVSRTGGYLAGMARRGEGVDQLGNKRWRRSSQAYAA